MAFCISVVVYAGAVDPALGIAVRGRLDPSFGEYGVAEISPAGSVEQDGVELSLEPDGASVVSGSLGRQIVRLRPGGSLDSSFGRAGLLRPGLSTARPGRLPTFFASSVAVDGRGRVLVFGEKSDTRRTVEILGTPSDIPSSRAVVLRFSRSGRRDLSFGEGKGYVRYDFGLTSPYSSKVPLVGAMAGTVDSENRPVLIAGVSAPTAGCFGRSGAGEIPRAVVRLTTAGLPDPTFGADGVSAIEGVGSYPQLQIDDQDQVAVEVGAAACRSRSTLYRLGLDGARLPDFASGGELPLSRMSLATVDPSGGLILEHRRQHELELVRLASNGSVDESFADDGMAEIQLPRKEGLRITSVVVDAENRIILGGFFEAVPANHQPRSAFVVARLLADGTLDPHFGKRGWITTSFARSVKINSAQAKLDQQGRLVIAGTANTSGDSNGEFVVARYLMDN